MAARKKTGKLAAKEVDKHVLALLKLGVLDLVLDYDDDLGVYILPAYVTEDPDGERPVPRLEYQVSDGLPGHRASSCDRDTYAEALDAFEAMKVEEHLRRNPPRVTG